MGNMKRDVYPLQTKENLGKPEIRNGNYTKSSTKSITEELTKTILQFTIKILGVLLIKLKNCYCHLLQSYHI
jgi:hypothetical protein